jgi:hypothetical protein
LIRRALLLPLLFLSTAAHAEPTPWQAEKCRLYESYWTEALDRFGSDNLNYAFIAANENFIASGCTEPASACPVSTQEQDIANALSILMINAGAASTFLPYRCPVR